MNTVIRHSVVGAASIFLIAGLAGCASTGEAPAAAPETTAPVEETAPEETTAPDATEQPGEAETPADWEITAAGIGPIRLGASLEEAAALVGATSGPRDEHDTGCLAFQATTPMEGSIGASGHDGRVETIWVFAPGQNHELRPDPSTVPRTSDGIGPGVSVGTVLDTWGPSNLSGTGSNIAWEKADGDGLIRAFSKDAMDDSDVDDWINLMMVHDSRVDGWCFD